jgi:group I intron endonuclease
MTVWTIYMITGPNGKRYVGLTKTSAKKRLNQHHLYARNGLKTALYNAMRAHGTKAFSISVLTECVDAREAIACERGLIAQYGTMAPNGYNLTIGGERGAGYTLSPEHKAKIAKTWPGRKHTMESRAKMRQAALGRKRSPEAIAKAVETMARISEERSVRAKKKWAANPEHQSRMLSKLNSRDAKAKKAATRRERFRNDPVFRTEILARAAWARVVRKRKYEARRTQ